MSNRDQNSFEFSQTRRRCGDVRTTKTEINVQAKLMSTNQMTHVSNEATTASGYAPIAPTTPGSTGVARQVLASNRRCMNSDRGLKLEQLDPNGIGPKGSGVVGGGPNKYPSSLIGLLQQSKSLRGLFNANVNCLLERPETNAGSGRFRTRPINQ